MDDADFANIILAEVSGVFDVDGSTELVHQLLRRQIGRANAERAQRRLLSVPQDAGELLPLSEDNN